MDKQLEKKYFGFNFDDFKKIKLDNFVFKNTLNTENQIKLSINRLILISQNLKSFEDKEFLEKNINLAYIEIKILEELYKINENKNFIEIYFIQESKEKKDELNFFLFEIIFKNKILLTNVDQKLKNFDDLIKYILLIKNLNLTEKPIENNLINKISKLFFHLNFKNENYNEIKYVVNFLEKNISFLEMQKKAKLFRNNTLIKILEKIDLEKNIFLNIDENKTNKNKI